MKPPKPPKRLGAMVDEMLADRAPVGMFELPQNLFLRQKAKRAARDARKDVRSYIRQENALDIVPHLPDPGERTHCILRGDFVLCSIIPTIIAARGKVAHLRVASLGVSKANTDTLAGLMDRKLIGELSVLTSHYFSQIDREDIFAYCKRELEKRRARLVVARVHAKVILLAAGQEHFVIEGSANLRANDGVEQMTIFNCPELHAFHAAWMEAIVPAGAALN